VDNKGIVFAGHSSG